MKTRVSILLWLAVSGTNRHGEAPICCRLTVHGKRAELRTGIWVAPKDWSDARKKVLGSGAPSRTANATLTKLVDELTDLWADLERQAKPVTTQALVRLYKGGGAVVDMLGLCDLFLAERGGLVGIEIAASSFVVDKARRKLLGEFIASAKLAGLRPEEFTHNLADKLLYWCLKERGHKRAYANKIVQFVSQCLRWGVRREHLQKSPLELYQLKRGETAEITYLGVAELAHLSTSALPVPCLDRVRDCFVFQCWTGLAYADVVALNVAASAEYHKQKDGTLRRVLRITRAKSTVAHGYECVIFLLPEAERVLAKYGDKLPMPSNQVYNRYLKQVGELCGIDLAKMCSHVGRKTAGTLLFNMGIPLPVVSRFLGHANTIITQKIYAKLLDTTIVDAFSAVFGAAPEASFALPIAPLELPATNLPTRPAQRLPSHKAPAKEAG